MWISEALRDGPETGLLAIVYAACAPPLPTLPPGVIHEPPAIFAHSNPEPPDLSKITRQFVHVLEVLGRFFKEHPRAPSEFRVEARMLISAK